MTVNNIVADFTADTTADAKWYRYGTGTALNTPDPETTNGEFTLFTCGEDSLMVVLSGSISCERRVMPLNVAAANIKIDTILACSAYAWKPTNDHTEILDEPGFYSYSPEGEDCDSTKAIELFFSTPLETTLAKQDACMDSYWSKYGHNIGFLKATVIPTPSATSPPTPTISPPLILTLLCAKRTTPYWLMNIPLTTS